MFFHIFYRHLTKNIGDTGAGTVKKTNKINYFFRKKSLKINVGYLFYIFKTKPRAKMSLKMFFHTLIMTQLNGHCIEQKVFAHHRKKSRGQRRIKSWSISLDEINNIGLVYNLVI